MGMQVTQFKKLVIATLVGKCLKNFSCLSKFVSLIRVSIAYIVSDLLYFDGTEAYFFLSHITCEKLHLTFVKNNLQV